MPNFLVLYLSKTINFIEIINATNLDLKLKYSTVFCRFKNRITKKLLN